MSEMISITISRQKQTFIVNPAVSIFIDGIKKTEIRSGENIVLQIEQGQHQVSFRLGIRQTDINANFIQAATITIRNNRGSGEIDAKLYEAEPTTPTYEWENQPRNDRMTYPDKRKTSPTVASLLSVLLVGLGQMINGQGIKGLLMMIAGMTIGAITGGIAAPLVWIVSAIDAYMCVNKLKQGKPIGKFSFF